MQKERWSDEEITTLKQSYASGNKVDLQKLFPGRTWRSIHHKALRLKIYHASIKAYLRPKIIDQLEHDDRVYLAGILDGEGTITIGIRKRTKTVKIETYESVNLVPLVSVTNTYTELIDWVNNILKSSRLKTPYEDYRGDRKTVHTVQLTRLLDVKCLLEQVFPYLKVKRQQAKIVIEFCTIRMQEKWSEHNPHLFDLAMQVRTLNKRGL